MSDALTDFVAEPQWVAWRNEGRDGKQTKVPYVARDRRAEADDRTTWLTHDKAAALAEIIINGSGSGGGIGIELGKCRNVWLAGIDFDTCRDPATGHIEPWAQDVLDRLGTYSEVSPSRTGIKAFLLIDPADIDALRAIMHTQHGRQFKRANGSAHPPAIELYVSNRYFAVTWQTCDDAPNEMRLVPLDDLRWLIEEAGPAFAGKAKPEGGSGSSDTILARLNRAAAHNKAVDTALRNAATMKGGSRSEGALGLGGALKRAGWSYVDMKAALLACPATRDWATKAQAEGDRQFERIWDKADAAPSPDQPAEAWPEPVDILASQDPGAAPILTDRHIPAALWPFVADTAERMGVATSTVALSANVSCAAAISEEWRLQPKRHDWTWTERACLWGAPIGPPGIMKTPVITMATAPLDSLEIAARERWKEEMVAYRVALADWKAAGSSDPEPTAPRMARYLVQSATVEALQEVLRDDSDGKFYAPLGKVLSKQDELAEFLAGMDRYSAGKGGGDRGAYLRLYDGGRFTVDRIGRGSFTANSWSGCIIGGIQPEPIQKIARDATDDGLIQRFMFDVPAPRGPGQDRGPDLAAIESYRSLFPALAALRPPRSSEGRIAHIVLHADAHAARESIDATARAMSLWPDASPQLQSAFSKWSGLFARLCLTYHLTEIAAARARGERGPPIDVVSPDTAGRVRAYMREILAPMLLRAEAIMFASRQTTHAGWIAGFIIAGELDRITVRDIVQSYRQLRAPEHREILESTMESLCSIGWLRPEPPRGGATRPTAWRINPHVHIRFAERAAAEKKRRETILADIATYVADVRGNR